MQVTVTIPHYIEDINRIESCRFDGSALKNSAHLTDLLISAYKVNKAECFLLAEELTLRGCVIEGLEPMIPNSPLLDLASVIVVDRDEGLYKSVRWNILGIPGFDSKFKPQSDMFFHGMVVEKFSVIAPSINTNLLAEGLQSIGFKIQCKQQEEYENDYVQEHDEETMDVSSQKVISVETLRCFIGGEPFIMWDELKERMDDMGHKGTVSHGVLKRAALDCGYCYYNRAFIKQGLKLKKAVGYCFEYFFKKRTTLDVAFYSTISEHLDKGFGIVALENRAIYNAIITNSAINRVEEGVFAYQQDLEIDEVLLQSIKDYIDSCIRLQLAVDAAIVFKHFRTELKPYGIKTPISLYQWIRRWYRDGYAYSKGKSLLIKSLEKSDVTNETLLLNLLQNGRGYLSKGRIAKELKWSIERVSSTVQQSNKLISREDGCVGYVSTDDLRKKDINQFYGLVIKAMPSNYAFADDLFFDLLGIDEAMQLLKHFQIDSPLSLSQVLRTTFKEKIKGNSKFVYRSASAVKSSDEAIVVNFPKVHTVNQISTWITNHGYSEQMARIIIEKLIDKHEYYYLNAFEVAHKSLIPSIIHRRAEVNKQIATALGSKKYLSPKETEAFMGTLPQIEFEWTSVLLGQVVHKYGYGCLQFKNSSVGKSPIVILPKKSDLINMKDLHRYIYENEYKGQSHEVSFYEYLARIGLYEMQDNIMKKKLRREVFEQGGLAVDAVGKLSLNDGRKT